MSPITTHVLDQASGRPASGVKIVLERQAADGWLVLGRGATDGDGRLKDLLPAGRIESGFYRLTFDVGAYFGAQGKPTFYGIVPIQFQIQDGAQHYHVPLLLSPFAYSTYRGS